MSPFRYAEQSSGPLPAETGPGPVESSVLSEIDGAVDRPGVAAVALAMARLLGDSKAKNQQPAAAKVLAALLDKLHSSARGRRGNLSLVKSMTASSPSA